MSRKNSGFPFLPGILFCLLPVSECHSDVICRLCWYAAEKYLRDLKLREDFPSRILDSLVALADFLVNEARIIESRPGVQTTHTEAARKEAKDAVPIDKVKDAPALARELRWRVRNARGVSSGDEGAGGSGKRGKSMSAPKENGVKRKRDSADVAELGEAEDGRQIYRNWRRKGWEREEFFPKKSEKRVERRPRPPVAKVSTDEAELGRWVKDTTDADDEMDQDQENRPDDEAVVETVTEVVVKVRRKYDAKEEVLERQRIERKVEVYKWPGKDSSVVGSEAAGLESDVHEEKPTDQEKYDGISNEGVKSERKGMGANGTDSDKMAQDGDEGTGEKENEVHMDEEIGQAKTESTTSIVVDVQA